MVTGECGRDKVGRSMRIYWTMVAWMFMTASAAGQESPQEKAAAKSRSAIEAGRRQEPSNSSAWGPRSFYLGFTPTDLLSTPEVSKAVYETLSQHADLVAFHFDQGVPWEEALNE
jgi:hypothetical protein